MSCKVASKLRRGRKSFYKVVYQVLLVGSLISFSWSQSILETLSLFNPIENFLSANGLTDIPSYASRANTGNTAEDKYPEKFKEVYDFVIIGAGSGGSVLANRLTENNWTVLLVEAGGPETLLSDIPLLAPFQTSTNLNWGYKNERQPGACLGLKDQRCNAARGKALGGTSTINFLIYTRGNADDYDSWSRLGNPGWSYQEILKYFQKSEDCSHCNDINPDYHGFSGPVKISNPRLKSPLLKLFLQGGKELGYQITDPNGQHHVGFSEAQATMSRGRRVSAAKAFLKSEDIKSRTNIEISSRTRAIKILLNDQNRAIGVEVIRNRQRYTIRTRKEVLLTAGTFNSPQLLMLSGIGPKDHLRSLGIEPKVDLQVGYNLQDHLSYSHLLFLVNESITISDTQVQNPRHVFNYLVNGEGPYTIPGGALGLGFVRTDYAARNGFGSDYPDMELVLGAGGLNGDTIGTLRQLLRLPDETYNKVYYPVRDVPGFSIAPVMLRPKSRGRVMLKDKNPLHWPLIYANYFDIEEDLEVLLQGVKRAIQVTGTKAFQGVNTRLHDIPLPACQHLVFGSDDYFRCALRQLASSLGHPVGTCKMGPDGDPSAVVDARLRVKGVRGLRVVDASIMPHIVAGHTNAVVMMIGEKAADMIKDDWSSSPY